MYKTVISTLGFTIILVLITFTANAGKIVWDFNPADGFAPVPPTDWSLAGTVEDWTFDGNPDNYDNSVYLASDFSDGYLHFVDDASIGSNLSLLTSDRVEVRDEYAFTEPGDRLWLICDYQMIKYGHRANLEPGTVDGSRGQIFWVSFVTSQFNELGIQYVLGNYNSEDYLYFTAIGNSDENQDEYLVENRLIEDMGDTPNLDRRVVTIRITENDDGFTVTVDVKFDGGAYKTIDSAYEGLVTNYPAGNGAGDEFILAVVGNNSGSGAIEFNMYSLVITDEEPANDSTPVEIWSLY